MTIIISCLDPISGHLHFVADRAETDDHMVDTVTKIYVRRDFVWGCAGWAPSRELLLADTLETFFDAAHHYLGQSSSNQLLLAEAVREGTTRTWRIWVNWREDDKPRCFNEVQNGLCAIGGYRGEWSQFTRYSSESSGLVNAVEFAGLVNQLNGLNARAHVVELGPLSPTLCNH